MNGAKNELRDRLVVRLARLGESSVEVLKKFIIQATETIAVSTQLGLAQSGQIWHVLSELRNLVTRAENAGISDSYDPALMEAKVRVALLERLEVDVEGMAERRERERKRRRESSSSFVRDSSATANSGHCFQTASILRKKSSFDASFENNSPQLQSGSSQHEKGSREDSRRYSYKFWTGGTHRAQQSEAKPSSAAPFHVNSSMGVRSDANPSPAAKSCVERVPRSDAREASRSVGVDTEDADEASRRKVSKRRRAHGLGEEKSKLKQALLTQAWRPT